MRMSEEINFYEEEEEETTYESSDTSTDTASSYEQPDESIYEIQSESNTETTDSTTESQVQEDTDENVGDQQTGAEDDVDVVDLFVLDGQQYSQAELMEALKVKQNIDNWNSVNTTRAQEIAEQKKALDDQQKQIEDALSKFNNQVEQKTEDPQIQETRKLLNDLGYVSKDQIEAILNERLAALDEVQETTSQLSQAQANKILLDELKEVQEKRELNDDEAWDVAQYAVDHSLESLDLDDVYVLMHKDNLEKAFNKSQEEKKDLEEKRKANAGTVLSTRGASGANGKVGVPNNKTLTYDEIVEKYSKDVSW